MTSLLLLADRTVEGGVSKLSFSKGPANEVSRQLLLTLCILMGLPSGLINILGIVHCTYLGVSGYNLKKMYSIA